MSNVIKTVRVNEKDNVVVVLQLTKVGDSFTLPGGKLITALDDIPIHHKITIEDIKKGGRIIKYGEFIGIAAEDLACGRWVHAHNLQGSLEYQKVIMGVFDQKDYTKEKE